MSYTSNATKVRVLTHASRGLIAFIVMTLVAMVAYPGGTLLEKHLTHYSFFENFFSDLGRTTTFLGGSNLTACLLFNSALIIAGVSLCVFFAILPALFDTTRGGLTLSILGSLIGIISGISFIGVALTPWDLFLKQHMFFVYGAFSPFLLVALLYIPAIIVDRRYPKIYAFIFMLFSLILATYLWLLFLGPSPRTPSGQTIQATGQKIIAYTGILTMLIQIYGARSVFENMRGLSYISKK